MDWKASTFEQYKEVNVMYFSCTQQNSTKFSILDRASLVLVTGELKILRASARVREAKGRARMSAQVMRAKPEKQLLSD